MMRWGFRVWQVVPSVLAAAGLGVATNLMTQSATAPLIIAFAAFVAMQIALGLWQGWRELVEARQARDAALGVLRPKAPPGSGDLYRLTAPFCPTPLWARAGELRGLVDWCVDKAAGPVRILAGAGGVGKSRLALALAEELPRPWVAGWLLPGGEVIARIAACPEPALVVVDDADRVAGLDELIASVAAHQDQVKVLLICRNGPALAATLRPQLPEAVRPLLGADPIQLEPVGAGGDRIRWFEQATQAYARQLGVPPPAPSLLPVGDDRDTLLLVHARALLAASGRHPARMLALTDIAEELLTLEQSRWHTSGPADTPVQALTEVVMTLALLPAATTAETTELLRRLPRYADAPRHIVTELAEWARAQYPPEPNGTLGLRPHLVTEWLLTSRLGQHRELLNNLPTDTAQTVFTTLARASHSFPDAVGLLTEAVHNEPALLAVAIGCADTAGLTPDLDRVLTDLVDPTNLAQVELLHALANTATLSRLQVRLYQVRVARLRQLAAGDPERYQPDLAETLTNLGATLRELGQPQQALPADREAVEILRGLAAQFPEQHRLDLAHLLTNLGATLWALGRPQEALPVAREAVEILRGLAEQFPERHRPELAHSLTNLGITLGALGRPQEALPVERESVEIRRGLAMQFPERYRPDLGNALINLGTTLRELGRPQEALPVEREAVEILRGLAEQVPERHRPDLALSLTNLGTTLQVLGQPQEALPVHREAVKIRRGLAEQVPERHRPDLALSLTNLGATLQVLGQPQEALPVHREAVKIRRGLAEQFPERYRPELAHSLTNLGATLLGQPQEALPVEREAVEILRGLAAQFPERHRPELALSLTNLGATLMDLGRVPDGVDARREAVTILRQCVADNPELYSARYRQADAALRQLLDQLGDHDSAVAPPPNSDTAPTAPPWTDEPRSP